MKILWLYRYTPHRHYNHWFHTDFAKAISKQDDIDLKLYGYRMEEREEFKNLLLRPYNKSMLMRDLKKEFDFDVIILDCWNRAYKSVSIRKMWLPHDFEIISSPKIVIEGDYHNIRNPQWFSDLNIDLILHRHLTNVKRANKTLSIKNLWFPCSIDNTIFKPDVNITREKLICAVGEMNNTIYKYRINAMNKLFQHRLMFREGLVKEEEYIKCLQKYVSHLNGSSLYDLNIAKMFEIMASGSVLLTDESKGIKELFPDDSYVAYKRDCSDIKRKAKHIINNEDYRKYITNNALKCIAEKHTHEIRARQLIDIIKKEFNI